MKFLSYEVGIIKPQPEICRKIVVEPGCKSDSCLSIGDTFIADYGRPIKNEFQARDLIGGTKSGTHILVTL